MPNPSGYPNRRFAYYFSLEDNVVVQVWSEKVQQEKGDSLTEGYVFELWDFTRISVTQNSLQELKEIWDQWDNKIKQLFYSNYGDLPYLLDVKVDKHLFRALAQYWNLAYNCFTFGKVDLVPTVEEYTTLLRCPRIQVDKAYSRAAYVPTFLKKLISITRMSEQWAVAWIKRKGDNKCIPWKNLPDLILAHPDVRKRVDIFALSIYGLVLFPKALGHVDEVVSDLFDRLDKRVTPVPVILDETFRPLNACRRAGEGRKLFPIKGINGYTKMRQHHGKEMDGDSPKSSRGGRRVESPTRRINILVVSPMTTPEYSWWWERRINDNIPMSSQEDVRPIEEHLQVVPSELEIIKQDFEKRSSEFGKKIKQLEEENMHLGLDVDIHKLESEKLRKGKNKAEEDLDSLKTDY
ncbi:hypothetical protein Goshw_024045 [Gossypium schwendimanii]|uniref:DUF7745 domain-containing protein n=2 Tax=Gossypium schwendimanii TaxID=34291 RepID=A0A7J9NDG4_GOSSC|nr:hypothetical protein [Gossypium schwendimanii]